MYLILKNATYINWETLEFTTTNILVEEGVDAPIKLFDDFAKLAGTQKHEVIDCSGKYVTKSFTVGHHHVYSALARGMPAPKKNPANFQEILQYTWWTLDKALDKDMIEASALATAIACAKAGSTFVIDHHASPNFIEGSLETIANAFDKIGLSHLLCYEITDRDGLNKAEQALQETENYIKLHQGLVGLHASFTVGEKTMAKAAALMQKYNSGIHIHVAEDLYDQQHCIKNYRKRVIERLNELGVLKSPKTILGHGLHLSGSERNIIRHSGAYVVQNTESNLNNNVGYFSSKDLGKNILLGTDGIHSDMIRSAQAAHFVGQGSDSLPFGDIYYRLRNAHHYLNRNNFKRDGENNLVVLDYPSPTPLNSNNFLGHFIFGLSSNHVQDVISDGKLIVKDRQIQTVDETEIMQFANEQALRLWGEMQLKY